MVARLSAAFTGIAIGLGIVVWYAFVLGIITKWLWNGCLVGAVNTVNAIGYWQAVGLNILFGILFKANLLNFKNGGKQ
jgi:hypothetical protein